MHLRDYLNDIPLKALKSIAETLGIDVEYRARIKLMNAIDRAFWDSAFIDRLIDTVSPSHQRVLSIVAFSYNAGVTEHAIVRKMERIEGLNRHRVVEIIHDLIPYALIGGIREESGVYFCPEDLAVPIRSRFITEMFGPAGAPGYLPSYSPPNLLEDIYSFLAAVYKESLPLTLMGNVRKNSLDRVFNGSMTCEQERGGMNSERRDNFVVDYCRERGLIDIGRRDVVITKKLKGWLELSTTERVHDIVTYALNDKIQEASTIITVISLFSEMGAWRSFDASAMALLLDTGTAASGGVKRLEARIRDILAIFAQLGLLVYHESRYSLIETGERFFKGGLFPQDERPGTQFTIQPNFEVICGPEFPPRLRFMLELLAERKSRDTVITFAVTREGIARARERNMSTDDIIRFFHEHSRTDLPQNVRFSIEAWANEYGTVFFETLTLMRCRTPEICDSIVHSPSIAPYIIEQLSDTALVVSAKQIPSISDHLRKAGFQPEAFGDTEPDSVLNGSGFAPTHLAKCVADLALPPIHQNFIFPERFLDKGDEQ